MESSAIIYTGRIMGSIIGNDIVTKAISEVTLSIYNILYNLIDINHPELDKLLETMDIKAQVQTLDSMIRSIDQNNYSKTMEISLHQLHEIICRIRKDLKLISRKHIEHKTYWISYLKKCDISLEMQSLKNNKNILDKRLDMFMKVLQVENTNSKKSGIIKDKTD